MQQMGLLTLIASSRGLGSAGRARRFFWRRPAAASSSSTSTSSSSASSHVDRNGTSARKWEKYGSGVIPMWVADMDIACPSAIVDAVTRRAAHPVYGYTDASAELVTAIVEGAARSWGVTTVDPAWIRWHPGLMSGLFAASRLAGPEGCVVVPTPIYPPFLNAAGDSSQRLEFPIEDFDVAKLETTLDEARAKTTTGDVVLLWCNPHNPTGRVWRREELEAVAEACRSRGVILLSDEVWSGLVLDDKATPFTSMGAIGMVMDDLKWIVLTSPSKTYNIASLDFALAFIPDDTLRRRYFRTSRDQAEVTPFGYAAAEAIFLPSADAPLSHRADVLTPSNGGCEQWRLELVEFLRENRDIALERLAPFAPGLTIPNSPEASYLLWIDARGLGLASPALYFEKHGVALTDGAAFGRRGFLRLNFGTDRATLEEGLKRIADAITDLPMNE